MLIEERIGAFLGPRTERSHYIPIDIYLEESLFVNDLSAGLLHQVGETPVRLFYLVDFLFFQRSAAVTYYAAAAFALFIVAGEVFRDDFF